MLESIPEYHLSGSHHTSLDKEMILLCMIEDTGTLLLLSSSEPVKCELCYVACIVQQNLQTFHKDIKLPILSVIEGFYRRYY